MPLSFLWQGCDGPDDEEQGGDELDGDASEDAVADDDAEDEEDDEHDDEEDDDKLAVPAIPALAGDVDTAGSWTLT